VEHSFPDPFLEPPVTGGARTVFSWQHLPLATCSQHKQNAIQHLSKWDSWMSLGITRLFPGQDALYFIPYTVWYSFDGGKVFLSVTILYHMSESGMG